MANDLGLVPRTVLSPPASARKRVALVAAAASGAAGLAGLWLRFDDGLVYRVVLAITSAIFAWLTMGVALSAKDATRAGTRALGISIVLGTVSTLIPCMILGGASGRMEALAIFIPFGAIFGGIVGFLYGIVLAVVAAATWRQVAAGTHDGADRAVRIASVWAIIPLAFIAAVVFGHDLKAEVSEWATPSKRDIREFAFPIGFVALGIAFNVALGSFWLATKRLARRRRWLESVTSGIDPRWRVREVAPHDDLGRLPRLRDGFAVLEHCNEQAIYRANATGEAIAII